MTLRNNGIAEQQIKVKNKNNNNNNNNNNNTSRQLAATDSCTKLTTDVFSSFNRAAAGTEVRGKISNAWSVCLSVKEACLYKPCAVF